MNNKKIIKIFNLNIYKILKIYYKIIVIINI